MSTPAPVRWEPTSEADVQSSIDDGTLTESHYFDVKREVGVGAGERADFARHLASFAVDGGSLLVGVEEVKDDRTWRLAPQALDGLPERLEQIATQLIDPPLYTVAHEIPSGATPGHGYLLVEVPPSPRAPHMVGGIYWGRGDRTRTRLSDAEVLRFHAGRESQARLAERLLDEEAARDPQPDVSQRQCGRLYGVAQPLTAPREVALRYITENSAKLHDLVQGAERYLPPEARDFEPAPHRMINRQRRAHGVALSDHTLTGPGRTLLSHRDDADPNEEGMVELEVRQDGGLRMLVGRLTASRYGRSRSGEDLAVVLDGIAVGYALRLVHWTATVATETGYTGTWVLGVHGTGMRGLASNVHLTSGWGGSNGTPFDAEGYRETTTATHRELLEQPAQVAHRLVGRLARALGTDRHWQGALGQPLA